MQQPPSLDGAKARLRASSQAITPLALLKNTVRRYPGVSIGVALTAGALSVRTLPRVYQSVQKHSWLALLISRWVLRIN